MVGLGVVLAVPPVPALAGAGVERPPHCASMLSSWIDDLDHDDRELITRRTHQQCSGAARWMKEQTLDAAEQVKQQICRDLVLIWTFKECEYQRDYIDRRSYGPCMAWSREMHRRCLADALDWFERDGQGNEIPR